MKNQRPRSLKGLAVLFTALLFSVLICLDLFTSKADIQVANQPASQGRTTTPAGSLVMDRTTRQPAIGALTVDFVRSPGHDGPDGKGRYLIAVNSGFGIQFSAATNKAQQSLSVIDLSARPAPVVIQNVYFPTPQSINVGLLFAPQADADGTYALYASGGFENRIWIFRFKPGEMNPISPASPGPNTKVEAPFIDLSSFSSAKPTSRINDNRVPVYPAGLAISPDGDTLFVANNLDDSLGIIHELRGARSLQRIPLGHANPNQFVYPYGVVALKAKDSNLAAKVYVSCWNEGAVATLDPRAIDQLVARIPVGQHPTAMILNAAETRLYVADANDDTVSVIDTATDHVVERINIRLAENVPIGNTPEGLALSADEATLFVANAHSNAVAVVSLSSQARGASPSSVRRKDDEERRESRVRSSSALKSRDETQTETERSRVRGFIPAGQYPSAVAVAGGTIFVGNGMGTGIENSSVVVNNSGRTPNLPNDRFPVGTGRGKRGGEYSLAIVIGNISAVPEPTDAELARNTQSVMRNNNLMDALRTRLFKGRSPIKHVIYVIKENRTYDQLFGDLARAGNGQAADGDPMLAIFGAGDAACVGVGHAQNITPNQRALALRFGLLDRFFVNAEASAAGHNWSTAAFCSDYVDKAYRWNYSDRGHYYDFEGFNRLPDYEYKKKAPPLFSKSATADDVAAFMRRYIPYLNGARDVAEPDTLYLWDAAARAGLSYRNYGEFIGTVSESDIESINTNREKTYPDTTPTVRAIATKKSLEGHFHTTFRNFDMQTPDAMTVDSYRTAKQSAALINPLITRNNPDPRFRGHSRIGEWLDEFNSFVSDFQAGRGDHLPQLSIMRLPNDHTDGLSSGKPTPQFYVADNDYAVGLLIAAVSHSAYWRDTAIFILEDDAQDGPDHVDAHRSPALVVSAYNRPGALVHTFHNTVSLIRTMEILLGLPPMNLLDATSAPIDIFRDEADLTPYNVLLPDVELSNLINPRARDAETAYWIKRSEEQDMTHADQADPYVLNQAIWFSVRGVKSKMPEISRLPAFDAMRGGFEMEKDEVGDR